MPNDSHTKKFGLHKLFIILHNSTKYIILVNLFMLPISDMFTTSTRAQSHGIEGYQVQKKYIGYNSEASKIKKA